MQDTIIAPSGARTKHKQRSASDTERQIAFHTGGLHKVTSQDCDALLLGIERDIIYNVLRAVPVDEGASTPATQLQADDLFERIRQAPSYKRSKEPEKLLNWQQLFHAGTVAIFFNGCVRYPRNRRYIKQTMLQVIACAVEAGLFVQYLSPPGSPKMSRLMPLSPIRERVLRDPKAFDLPPSQCLVQMFTRGDQPVEIEFDPTHPVAADTQRRLELINAVNSTTRITFTPYDPWQLDFIGFRRLRPIHRARFTEHWDWHGRLYTGRYGHQSLSKIERRTIQFNGEPCIELDYCGMHTRLLYHRLGIECQGDPYALWGPATSGAPSDCSPRPSRTPRSTHAPHRRLYQRVIARLGLGRKLAIGSKARNLNELAVFSTPSGSQGSASKRSRAWLWSSIGRLRNTSAATWE